MTTKSGTVLKVCSQSSLASGLLDALAERFLGVFVGGNFGLQGPVGRGQLVGALLLGDVDDRRAAESLLPRAVLGGDALDQHVRPPALP